MQSKLRAELPVPVYQAQMSQARLSACMLIPHKGHTDTIQVYSVTVMTHVKALQAGHSGQGTSEPITPVFSGDKLCTYSIWGKSLRVTHAQCLTGTDFGSKYSHKIIS